MEFRTTTSDLGIIAALRETIPKNKQEHLEIITEAGDSYQNPSWQEIKDLHREYGILTLEYRAD